MQKRLLIITAFCWALLNIFPYRFHPCFAVYGVMLTKNGLRKVTLRRGMETKRERNRTNLDNS